MNANIGLMSYIGYLCLFAYSGVQHVLRFVLLCLRIARPMLPVSLECPFLIATAVFLTFIYSGRIQFLFLCAL